ncbi:MAG: hypothetical protein A4S09_07325 [Proteobacteria bacterium SG_bin7]|nr:MAG: hypothetical protein A4S09_07325 [Proteobacteria bacterium SG_bin7]
MSSFKLVILDYAKNQLNNSDATKCLNDLIVVKQKNFERTDPDYVVVDKHDMIGSHFMIYETSNPYSPKLVFAIRNTYEDRAAKHKLKTPFLDLVPVLSKEFQDVFNKYRGQRGTICDCNSWFVDPSFSQKNSGLRLSDIGYVMVYLQLRRMGFDHFVGCTNEKYKAHRWVEHVGSFPKNMTFIHPTVPDPHMIILIEQFNRKFLLDTYSEYKVLFDQIFEIVPADAKYMNIQDAIKTFITTEVSDVLQLPTLQEAS